MVPLQYALLLNHSILSYLLFSAPDLYNSDYNTVLLTNQAHEGVKVSIEADLRSGEREERRIRFLVNGERDWRVIVGVPESIRFGVSLILFSLFIHHPNPCEGYSL